MKNVNTIKINFKGGIIYPDQFYNILVAASKFNLLYVRFGLRQQLLFDVEIEDVKGITDELNLLGVSYEVNTEEFPNIVSSYPAEEIFIIDTWLNENIYAEIFGMIDYSPRLKINISDANQSFTPLLTGNINWVAAAEEKDFWYLFIRFPKTNVIYEWKNMVNTKSVAAMSLVLENAILKHPAKFYDNDEASGEELFELVKTDSFDTKKADSPAVLPPFKLPYYEGLNRYKTNYWLGIYRRDELFSI